MRRQRFQIDSDIWTCLFIAAVALSLLSSIPNANADSSQSEPISAQLR